MPVDNKLVETYVGLSKSTAKSAMFESGVTQNFWFWFLQIATHIINLSPQSTLGSTPFEAAFGTVPSVHGLRVPGFLVIFKNNTSGSKSYS